MKKILFGVGLAVAIAGGCASKKPPATDSSAMDLSPTAETTGTPVAYSPAPSEPVQTAAPDASASNPIMGPGAGSSTGGSMASGNSYTVKPGDTLWKIAASHYGDGKKWHQIVDANPGLEPSKLRIGMTITLP